MLPAGAVSAKSINKILKEKKDLNPKEYTFSKSWISTESKTRRQASSPWPAQDAHSRHHAGTRLLLFIFKVSFKTQKSETPQFASPSRKAQRCRSEFRNSAGRTHACRGRAEPRVCCRGRPPPRFLARLRHSRRATGRTDPGAGIRRRRHSSQGQSANPRQAGARRPLPSPRPLRRLFQTLRSGELPAPAGSEGATGSLIKAPQQT